MKTFILLLLACLPSQPAVADTPVTLGAPLPAAELPIEIPDPNGRTVILELIRSADW